MFNNKKKSELQISFYSHSAKEIQTAVNLFEENLKQYPNDVIISGPIFLPKKKSTTVLLRSPHVNKASREKFVSKKYKAILRIKFDITFLKSIKYLDTFLDKIPGVSTCIRVTY